MWEETPTATTQLLLLPLLFLLPLLHLLLLLLTVFFQRTICAGRSVWRAELT